MSSPSSSPSTSPLISISSSMSSPGSPSLSSSISATTITVDSFYSGQSILMTGASGFLGKVILEKLLRDCRSITNIYVLLRSKQGVDPRRRVEELTNSVVFSRLRRENESLLQKIIPVSGDVTMPGLGISPSDERKLEQQVSIVFHVAATIRFDEPLR